uniref:Uncharacterized protein n=1 Tax=mine drainage metagenome TaxID=410659 RepID=E6QXB2_9ZZZZ
MLYINRRPRLKQLVLVILTLFPALKRRLGQIAVSATAAQRGRSIVAAELAHPTPRARRIYAELKAAKANHDREGR